MEDECNNDLSLELRNKGWQKCWSKSNNMFYYFNVTNGSSVWEMPDLSQPTKRKHSCRELTADGSLTEISDEATSVKQQQLLQTQYPSTSFRYWNFSIANNITQRVPASRGSRNPVAFMPPHPHIEWFRAQAMFELHEELKRLCEKRENICPPQGSFSRWILDMKLRDSGTDPLLPSECDPPVSGSLVRELGFSIPFTMGGDQHDRHQTRNKIIAYMDAAKQIVDNRNTDPDGRKMVKWNVIDSTRWLQANLNPTTHELEDRLTHLYRQCQPHLIRAVQSSLEEISIRLLAESRRRAQNLARLHYELIGVDAQAVEKYRQFTQSPYHDTLQIEAKEEDPLSVSATEGRHSETKQRASGNNGEGYFTVTAHPPPLAVHSSVRHFDAKYPVAVKPMKPTATQHFADGMVSSLSGGYFVQYNHAQCFISELHYEKLRQLYQMHTSDDPAMHWFASRLWCLLQRYQTFLVCHRSGSIDGLSNQAALPSAVFQFLQRQFDVSMELFASPLNCYFAQYCSAFIDTDIYFGSVGPTFDFYPESGSFEVNPPFCEELLLKLYHHLDLLLCRSSQPLSFVVFLPEWHNPPYEALSKFEASPFKRSQLPLSSMEHSYRIANFPYLAHVIHELPQDGTAEANQISCMTTLVVFLQNESGCDKWPVLPEKLQELLRVYREVAGKCTKTTPTEA